MRTHCAAIALTIAASMISACTAQARSPEPVPLDRVECARCRMLISSETGAGQIVAPSEDTRFYDDIGCLAADWAGRRPGARAYVRTAGGLWTDAEAAFYAQPADSRTAMGSGVVAFANAGDARGADRAGHASTFDEVLRLTGAPR